MQLALLVDDSKSARIIISRLLQKHGLEVLTAESGEAALEMLKERTPDVIFMDYMMPGLNGIQTMHRIHALPGSGHIPVVICTGNEGESYFEEAVSEGASSLLSKPPSPEGIQKALDDIERVLKERAAASSSVTTADTGTGTSSDPAIQQAVDAAVTKLRAEFESQLNALRKELGSRAGTTADDETLKVMRHEIDAAKKAVFEAVVQRMQQQQAKLIESIKSLLSKQRAETLAMIKKAMGGGG